MSYILDALKRAESERSRGAVPGVHAQVQPAATSTAQGRNRTLWVLGGAITLAAVAAGVWWWMAPAVTPTRPVSSKPAPSGPVVAAAPVEAAVSRAAEPAPAAPLVVPPAAVLPPIPALPVTPVPSPAVPAVAPPPPTVPKVAGAVPPTATKAPVTPTADQARVPTLAELPDTVRQQLPAMAFSGGTYSENPLYRMVIVNGQVLHEGDTAAPGVVLEKIRPKEVVLRTQGYRYTTPY